MKSLLFFILAFTLSSAAFARQYFQCSVVDVNSTDVMVVNLQTVNGGTLFLSSGMQNPEDERILVNIEFDKVEGKNHIYKVVNKNGTGYVSIPSEVIGKPSNSLMIDLSFANFTFEYSCFTRIYND